jgi:hypothetical protein
MPRRAACDLAGIHPKALQRYTRGRPAFAAKLDAAKRGLPYEPEEDGEHEHPAPPDVLDVEVVGERPPPPAPWVPPARPAPPSGEPSIAGMTGAEFGPVVRAVALNPDHPQWGKVAPMVFAFLFGPEMIRAKREAEREQALQPKLGESTSRAKLREILERAKPVGA